MSPQLPQPHPGRFDLISRRKRVQTLARAFNAAALIWIDTDTGGQLLTFLTLIMLMLVKLS